MFPTPTNYYYFSFFLFQVPPLVSDSSSMERYFTRTMWIIRRLSFLPSVNEQLVVLGVVVKRVTDRMGVVNDVERKKSTGLKDEPVTVHRMIVDNNFSSFHWLLKMNDLFHLYSYSAIITASGSSNLIYLRRVHTVHILQWVVKDDERC